uniref:Methenyltetrahydrofolate synthetase domain containing n=1 Tax=Sinocyclocheilus rhinocerous TaxID=307959 RepID=A0A673MY63_9TELE
QPPRRCKNTKWDIRHKVWNYIEVKNLASFPRPVHNRIPNFKGALEACEKVPLLEIFTKAAVVKVDPDKPLEGVRLASLQVYCSDCLLSTADHIFKCTSSTCLVFCIVCII